MPPHSWESYETIGMSNMDYIGYCTSCQATRAGRSINGSLPRACVVCGDLLIKGRRQKSPKPPPMPIIRKREAIEATREKRALRARALATGDWMLTPDGNWICRPTHYR